MADVTPSGDDTEIVGLLCAGATYRRDFGRLHFRLGSPLISLFGHNLIHEIGHALALVLLTKEHALITDYCMIHLDDMSPTLAADEPLFKESSNKVGFWVVLAGPLANLVTGGLIWGNMMWLGALPGLSAPWTTVGSEILLGTVLQILMGLWGVVGVMFGLANLVPGSGDGSVIWRTVHPISSSLETLTPLALHENLGVRQAAKAALVRALGKALYCPWQLGLPWYLKLEYLEVSK